MGVPSFSALAAAMDVNITLIDMWSVPDGEEISFAALCHHELCVETCFLFMQEVLVHLRASLG